MLTSLQRLDTICSSRFEKFTYSVIALTFLFGSFHLINGHYENGFVDLSVAFLSFLNLKIPKSYHSCFPKTSMFILIGTSLLVYLLFTGGIGRTGWLWVLTYPPFVFLLDSKRRGVRWVLSFATILLFFNIFQYLHWIKTAYTHTELFILLIVYTLVAYLIYLFKKEVNYYINQLQSVNSVLEKRVSSEIQKNRQKDEMLNNQAKQAQMGEMIGMIAHQWRQPLNAISAASINLNFQSKMGVLEEQSIQEVTQFIQKKTQEMSIVIDTFVEFIKPQQRNKEFFPLEAIQKTVSIIGPQLSNHTITLEVTHSQGFTTYTLHGVINLLEQVLLNLLVNSRDAFDEHPDIKERKITIFGDESGRIIFEDNAGGIVQEIQEKVFNPYFTTKEQGKGTGLGLYMSRKIMKDHFGGDLTYRSTEGGSRFILTFVK